MHTVSVTYNTRKPPPYNYGFPRPRPPRLMEAIIMRLGAEDELLSLPRELYQVLI